MPTSWRLPAVMRLIAAPALCLWGCVAGCTDRKAAPAPDASAAVAGDLFRAGEHWVCLATDGGGLARVPRGASAVASAGEAASFALNDKAPPAVPILLPPAEAVAPVSWVEAQRLQAIETSRAQRLAATTANPRTRAASAAASTGERTVRLFVQPGSGERSRAPEAGVTPPHP
jgi:hypothetical protein